MKKQAEQMLIELQAQERNTYEQLMLTRGAIQAIEHLLAVFEETVHDAELSNDPAN